MIPHRHLLFTELLRLLIQLCQVLFIRLQSLALFHQLPALSLEYLPHRLRPLTRLFFALGQSQ